MGLPYKRDMAPGPSVSDTDIDYLRWVNQTDTPFAVVDDLLDKTSTRRKQTHKRLEQLVESGQLKAKKVGRGKVYWLSDAGRGQLTETC